MERSRLYGFTLVEVLCAVLILSIVAGLTLPSLVNVHGKLVLKITAYEIVHLMRTAQSRAIARHGELRLASSGDYAAFWLDQKGEHGYISVSGQFNKVVHVPSDLHVEADNMPIVFYPDGRIDRAEISLCKGNDCFSISTKEQYAHIKISEWTAE